MANRVLKSYFHVSTYIGCILLIRHLDATHSSSHKDGWVRSKGSIGGLIRRSMAVGSQMVVPEGIPPKVLKGKLGGHGVIVKHFELDMGKIFAFLASRFQTLALLGFFSGMSSGGVTLMCSKRHRPGFLSWAADLYLFF